MDNRKSDLSYALALACDNFTKNYRETLNQVKGLSKEQFEAFYNLGADIKHTFDDFAQAIRNYIAD